MVILFQRSYYVGGAFSCTDSQEMARGIIKHLKRMYARRLQCVETGIWTSKLGEFPCGSL